MSGLVCPQCRSAISADDCFCGACGARLAAATPPEQASAAPEKRMAVRTVLAVLGVVALLFFAWGQSRNWTPARPSPTPVALPKPPPVQQDVPRREPVAPAPIPPRINAMVGEFTPGACAAICDSTPACKDVEMFPTNPRCTVTLDTSANDMQSLLRTCPRAAEGRIAAEFRSGRWVLTCGN